METAFLTVAEAAAVIKVGRSKTYQMVRSGELPSVKIGRSRRVPARKLQDWIERKTDESEQGRR